MDDLNKPRTRKTVDFSFLINQKFMLTLQEFESKNLQESYTEYIEKFFQRRLVDVYEALKDKIWFIERYIIPKKADSNISKYEGNIFVVITDCFQGSKAQEIYQTFSTSEAIKNVFITQKDASNRFDRDVYIELTENADPDKFMTSLNSPFNSNLINIKNIKINENYHIPAEKIYKIYKTISKMSKFILDEKVDAIINSKNLSENQKIISLTNILRDTYKFCTTCFKQYDNNIEMLINCSKHSLDSFRNRNIELICTPLFFDDIKYLNEEFEVEKKALITPMSTYKCTECGKAFETIEFARKHIISKHNYLIATIKDQQNKFEIFLRNIDLLMLDHIEGWHESNLPFYCRVNSSSRFVTYDIPKLFSGDPFI